MPDAKDLLSLGATPYQGLNLLPAQTLLNTRYRVLELLRLSGNGFYYLATDEHLDRSVIVQEFLLENSLRTENGATVQDISAPFKEGLANFVEVAKKRIQLNEHPNLLTALDFFQENQTAYLVYSAIEGLSLNDFLEGQSQDKAPQEVANKIIRQVISAVHALNEAGIVHGNINPESVYLTRDGQVKLGYDEPYALAAYKAPEQLKKRPTQTVQSDVFGVSALYYRLLTGAHPPLLNSPKSLISFQEDSNIVPETQKVIQQAMEYKATHRLTNVQHFQEALGLFVSGGTSPAARTIETDTHKSQIIRVLPQPWFKQRTNQMLLGVTLLSVLGFIGSFFAFRNVKADMQAEIASLANENSSVVQQYEAKVKVANEEKYGVEKRYQAIIAENGRDIIGMFRQLAPMVTPQIWNENIITRPRDTPEEITDPANPSNAGREFIRIPEKFFHYFLVLKDGEEVTQGSIIKGSDWEAKEWMMVHGYGKSKYILHKDLDNLWYLGNSFTKEMRRTAGVLEGENQPSEFNYFEQ